ncbi:PAS domain-containing sensor histidine kinase [Candidatus Peribacteria bacterium]|nr:PAS domain-containing sensor histidine kinase [Candidatus Peribacteria bacterium]
MPTNGISQRQRPSPEARILFSPRGSMRRKVLRQSVLLVSFCVLLLGGLSFTIIQQFRENIPSEAGVAFVQYHLLGLTVLILSGLLLVLAILLSTLLARDLARPLQELSAKVRLLQPGTWLFRRTVHTDDEVEELDRTILRSIEYGVITTNTGGAVTDVNPAACLLLQRSRDELIGQPGSGVIPLFQRKLQPFTGVHPIQQVLEKRVSYRSHPSEHLSVQRKDEAMVPVTLLVVPLISDNELFGTIAVLQEQSLERQIDYMKSEFISLASHQLRTPLSTIRWYVEMLESEEGSFSEEHKSYLDEVDVAANRMANLIDALLHVARLEDGALAQNKEKVDITSFFQRIIEGWSITMKKQGISFVSDLPTQRAEIFTDPVLLEIVMQNLFTNAVKYSLSKKDIILKIHADAHQLHMSVQDEGMGIPEAEQKRIFQKFFRAKNVREVDTDGSGLGLYMSKKICENLGGALSFSSKEGQGTTFMVVLPL